MDYKTILYFAILFLFLSCDKTKEKELEAREQRLIQREAALSEKESDYQSLLRLRDSLRLVEAAVPAVKDSVIPKWPDSLSGSWNSRLVCRETSCKTYVIGDQRTETWILANDSLGPLVKVMENKKLKRILKAVYQPGNAKLTFVPDSLAGGTIKINAVLDEFSKNVIKGTQTLIGQDGCTVKFSIELSPTPKK